MLSDTDCQLMRDELWNEKPYDPSKNNSEGNLLVIHFLENTNY